MDTLSYKTISANKATVKKEWVVVDATDQVLGRMCAKVAKILRGKYKPCYTPHVDCGDNVIIINADKVQLTGKKGESRLFKRVLKGMLPKNKLGAQLLRNVYIYGGSEHPHAAQTPKTIDINTLK